LLRYQQARALGCPTCPFCKQKGFIVDCDEAAPRSDTGWEIAYAPIPLG